jgi:O-phosphoseryl-tRNA(Cys) synthetase
MNNRDRIYTKEKVKAALEKHETRSAVALALDCSVSTVSRLIDKTFPDLKHLAKWKAKSKKIWGY